MDPVNLACAKTHLSRLVDEAAAGEGSIIARAGKPLVKVVPVEDGAAPRLGFLAGAFSVPDDSDRMGADALEGLFAGAPGTE